MNEYLLEIKSKNCNKILSIQEELEGQLKLVQERLSIHEKSSQFEDILMVYN